MTMDVSDLTMARKFFSNLDSFDKVDFLAEMIDGMSAGEKIRFIRDQFESDGGELKKTINGQYVLFTGITDEQAFDDLESTEVI